MIAYHNHLYIFTKNWGNGQTNIYELPKVPGTYSATQVDNFNPQGLITDAVYNAQTHCVMLIGYTYTDTFVIKLSGFSNNLFSNGQIERVNIQVPTGYSKQIEGITVISTNEYYVSAETYNNPTALYAFNEHDILSVEQVAQQYISVYPNPASNYIYLNTEKSHTLYIYDFSGKLLISSTQATTNIEKLVNGIYFVLVKNAKERIITQLELIVNN